MADALDSDSLVLAWVVGGFQWQDFRRSEEVTDTRSAWSVFMSDRAPSWLQSIDGFAREGWEPVREWQNTRLSENFAWPEREYLPIPDRAPGDLSSQAGLDDIDTSPVQTDTGEDIETLAYRDDGVYNE